MTTLDSQINIPSHVRFTLIGEDAFLLNMNNKKYYSLENVGAHLWQLFAEGKSLRLAYESLLKEYEVEAHQLEQDVLELLEDLKKNELLEITD